MNSYTPKELELEIRKLYKQKKYLDIFALYNEYENLFTQIRLDLCYFNKIISSLIYIALSYFALEDYNISLAFFREVKAKYNDVYSIKRTLQNKETLTKLEMRLLNGIKQELHNFNLTNRTKFYINCAYTYYKINEKGNLKENNEKALYYYKKALLMKNISDSQFMQCLVGIAEVKYRFFDHKSDIPENFKKEFQNIYKILLFQKTSFDTYLSLGKINYFMQEYDDALIYVQKALELTAKDEEKRIFAYDWMSRIAYVSKQYSTASVFYEKIIDELVNYPDQQQEEIHQRPKLYKMVRFLNETKTYLAQEETSKLSKSIWAGISITTFFELINCYKYYKFDMLFCVGIGIIVFIFIYTILHTNIEFTKFLNTHFPTYSKFVKRIFRKII